MPRQDSILAPVLGVSWSGRACMPVRAKYWSTRYSSMVATLSWPPWFQ